MVFSFHKEFLILLHSWKGCSTTQPLQRALYSWTVSPQSHLLTFWRDILWAGTSCVRLNTRSFIIFVVFAQVLEDVVISFAVFFWGDPRNWLIPSPYWSRHSWGDTLLCPFCSWGVRSHPLELWQCGNALICGIYFRNVPCEYKGIIILTNYQFYYFGKRQHLPHSSNLNCFLTILIKICPFFIKLLV